MKASKIRILVIAVLAAAVFSVQIVYAFEHEQHRWQADEPTYASPYDWGMLAQEDGRFTYEQNNVIVSRLGIDVSEHQDVIDWDAVADNGITFAFIRLGNRGYTEGNLRLDARYLTNIEGAKAANIKVGVYFFSQAINEDEAREEAEFVLEHLNGQLLDYPVVYDFEPVETSEGRANQLSHQQVSNNARTFCERIEAGGYPTMIYGNAHDIARYDADLLANHEVWYAEYDAAQPSAQFDFAIWQFASNGNIAGIDQRVDLNIQFIATEH